MSQSTHHRSILKTQSQTNRTKCPPLVGGPIKQIVLCHSESIENLCERCEHINFLLFRISTKQKAHGHPELVSTTVPNKSCNQYVHIVKLRNKIVLNSKNGLPQSCKCTLHNDVTYFQYRHCER